METQTGLPFAATGSNQGHGQRGLASGDTILAVVYPTIFLSIMSCAVLVFLIERGALDGFANVWLRRLQRESTDKHAMPSSLPSFDALSVMKLSEFQEPNPIIDFEAGDDAYEQPSAPGTDVDADDELEIERGEAG